MFVRTERVEEGVEYDFQLDPVEPGECREVCVKLREDDTDKLEGDVTLFDGPEDVFH